jgi:glycosyltransferase involved in cell wall biosynthesis
LQLKVAGLAQGNYGRAVLGMIENSPFKQDIAYLGKVDPDARLELMRRSHLITVTSVKEGWGLIVSEAASQGTPAVVYNVDGLRDSVQHARTGMVTPPTPEALADGIVAMLENNDTYHMLRERAWHWSKELTFDKSYEAFKEVVAAI